MTRRIVAACFCLCLSACGGGGGSGPAPATSQASTQSNGTATLLIPAQSANASQRSREFVSPSASSVAIAVNGGAPTVADISSTSTACTTVAGGRSCTVAFSAPNGNDTILFTLYDAPNATGNVLGTGSATPTVVGGAPFNVTVSVDGTVAKIVVSTSATFTQGTASSTPVTVTAEDSGGNTIIGSAYYAAPINLTDSDTSGSTTLSTTVVGAPSTTVTLSYNGGTVTGGTVTISANAHNVAAGNVTPATVAVSSTNACAPSTSTGHLFVANDGGGNALEFAPPYTAAGTSLFSVGNPIAAQTDHLGNLFVAAFGSGGSTSTAGDVLEYASPYTGSAVATIGAGLFHGPRGIALDGSGNLFATDSGNNRVLEFAPANNYSGAPTVLLAGIANSYAIALAPNCNLFVTSGSTIVEYAPPYTGAAVATITSGLSGPQGLAFDAAGHLFVADAGNNAMYEFAAPYTGAPIVTIALPSSSTPQGPAVDAAGNLFVDEYGISAIAEYAPPYTGAPTTTISSGSGLSLPAGLGFGP